MAKDRPLRNVYQRLGNFEPELTRIVLEKDHVDVLEVGCGLGLPMIQLIRRFGDKISITGINRDAEFNDPEGALRAGVRRRALWPWVPFTHRLRYPMPTYVNCDAAQPLPFADDSFDFCYSMAMTFFLTNRIAFLSEVNRVLRPGRIARLHFTHTLGEFADYRQSHAAEDLNMLLIRDGDGRSVPATEILEDNPNIAIRQSGRFEYLELTATADRLVFPLEFTASRLMTEISPDFPDGFQRSEYRLI